VIGAWRLTQPIYLSWIFTSLTAIKDPNKRDALLSSSELSGRHIAFGSFRAAFDVDIAFL